ncbi:MAG: tetratricopeptide repeat protein [Polyangiaceae bacterium]
MRRGALLAGAFGCALVAACGWNPSRPFDREAPAVNHAIADLDGGDAASAASRLEDYLSTGACKEGNIGVPDLLKRRADGTFDLGLSLFRIGEQFGRRFGEEEIAAGVDEQTRAQRHAQTECARRVTEAIAEDESVPVDLRARARYLSGNLAFLDGDYEDAVKAYDRALVLAPGEVDAGDPVGRDAAWNRAIALRRIEDRKDAGQDASNDASQDAPHDASQEAGKDSGQDAAPEAGRDGGQDSGGGDGGAEAGSPDGGGDSGEDGASPPQQPDGGSEPDGSAPPPPTSSEDERMLDQLENAPTLQQEEAKRAGKKRVRGMADK